MSWNCLFIVVEDTAVVDLEAVGLHPDGPPLSADEASRSEFEGVAAVQSGTDLLLLNPLMDQVDLGQEISAQLGREAVSATFAGVSDTYRLRVDGPGLERELVHQYGEVVVQTGEPLPEEAGTELLDEDSLFALIEARTGLPGDWIEREAIPLVRRSAEPTEQRPGLWGKVSRLWG